MHESGRVGGMSRASIAAAASWVLIACLCFAPGLGGPFLLDDLPNLQGVFAWANGHASLSHVLSEADAGPLGRPLSLLSFALTAATSGSDPLGFKVANLAIHLANGLLAGALLQRVFGRLPHLAGWPRWAAWLAAAAWVALPMHVPTVLYVVQRMTLLSATLTLVALLAWFSSRERLERDPEDRFALALLWIGVPLSTVLAALAKENGLLAPLLCAVFELTLFRASARPKAATWFVRIAVVLPVLVTAAYLATHPAYVLGGYAERPFSFFERVLSQPRALWEYVGLAMVPDAGRLGLYQDTFAVSTGWSEPFTTSLASLGWLTVVALALACSRSLPGFTAGVFFFLAGHAMESSVFALEVFFVHRNYVPSLGILLAASAVLAILQKAGPFVRRLLPILVPLVLVAWALTTTMRAWVWGDGTRLMVHELHANPDSLRLRSDLVAHAIASGRLDIALHHLEVAETLAPADERRAVNLWRVLAYCSTNQQPPATVMDALRDGDSRRITPYVMRALDAVAARVETGTCPNLSAGELADAATDWLRAVPRPPSDATVWRSRYAVARLYASGGQLHAAQSAALRAFDDSGHAFPPGVLAFQLSSSLSDLIARDRVYQLLLTAPRSGDPREERALESFADSLGKPSRVRRGDP